MAGLNASYNKTAKREFVKVDAAELAKLKADKVALMDQLESASNQLTSDGHDTTEIDETLTKARKQ